MKKMNMQKRPKLQFFEYSGAGWYGEVYEVAPNRWAWAVGVELHDRSIFEGGVGFDTPADAVVEMDKAVVWLCTRRLPTPFHMLA